MVVTEKYGTYHATNEDFCSGYEFAYEIFKQANIDVCVKPIKTEEYKSLAIIPAKRPLNRKLSKASLTENGFDRLPELCFIKAFKRTEYY